MGIEIRLLGGFSVTAGGEPLPDRAWRLRKARTVVKLLALASRRTLHRGQLIELLWPEHEPHRAANNLDQAVHAARRALGPEAIGVQEELVTLMTACTVDVDAFEDAVRTARASETTEAFEAAVGLFAGELLPEDRYEASRGPWLGWCWLALADARSALGNDDTASDALERARVVFEQMGDARGLELCSVPA